MPEHRTPTDAQPSFLRRSLELAVLTGLAVAQPIYDLLARSPEFLPVHGAGLPEVLTLAAGLSLVIPLAWSIVIHLGGLITPALGSLLHTGSLYLLASLFFLQLADAEGGRPSQVVMVTIVLTAGFVLLDRRTALTRRFLSYLSPAILIFPIVLLTRPEIRSVLMPAEPERIETSTRGIEAPVVFVVFDGLPLTSLLESDRRIDPVRYPAFARLARTGTWFPRATTMADNTLEALPAIVSGRRPTEPLPIAAYYPRNIFTLLNDSHELIVHEPLTQLCPQDLCPEVGSTFRQRTAALVSDTGVAYLHLVVPDRMSHRLPQIQTSWRNFLALERSAGGRVHDRVDLFRSFVGRVAASDEPRLFFLHTELPHSPHVYLPTGERYTAFDNEPSGEGRQFAWWSDDIWAVVHSQQRHLLQVGLVDSLLGELLEALEQFDLFDSSLIVVTSDHGVSFHPGRSRRLLEAENAHDVLSVPLLIKLPGQRDGKVDERRVELIDVLPTVTDLFDVDWSTSMDGHSLLDPDWPGRNLTGVLPDEVDEAAFESQRQRSLDRKLDAFGTGSSHGTFVRADPFPELIGLTSDASADSQVSRITVTARVETGPGVLPLQVTGTVSRQDGREEPACLAVAADGIVRGTTCAYRGRAGSPVSDWSVLLDTPILDPESLEVFLVDRSSGALRLQRSGG